MRFVCYNYVNINLNKERIMRYIVLFLVFVLNIFASVVQVPVKSVDESSSTVTVEIDNIDVGMSGFIVHEITPKRKTILKNVTVKSFDENSKVATLSMSDFDSLQNDSLPNGNWKVKEGDEVLLAFAYNRALLIAPNEDIYYRISKAVDVEWIHSDIFAGLLSINGHPTPLKSDFLDMTSTSSVGLIYFYIDQRLYTVDAKSFKILSIADAPLEQKTTILPFYSRIGKIDNNWWNMGAGTSQLSNYSSYYKALLKKHNPEYAQEIR
jgi:hypothetical protein